MAIHKTVFYSPDRHIRISLLPGSRVYTVERDLVLVDRFNLSMLESWLREQGIDLADLIED